MDIECDFYSSHQCLTSSDHHLINATLTDPETSGLVSLVDNLNVCSVSFITRVSLHHLKNSKTEKWPDCMFSLCFWTITQIEMFKKNRLIKEYKKRFFYFVLKSVLLYPLWYGTFRSKNLTSVWIWFQSVDIWSHSAWSLDWDTDEPLNHRSTQMCLWCLFFMRKFNKPLEITADVLIWSVSHRNFIFWFYRNCSWPPSWNWAHLLSVIPYELVFYAD